MTERAFDYMKSRGLSEEEAAETIQRYRDTYGQLVRGLIKNHDIDPHDFDKRCDQAVPLENMLHPCPALRKLLEDIDRTKMRVWGFTNAYIIVCSSLPSFFVVHTCS